VFDERLKCSRSIAILSEQHREANYRLLKGFDSTLDAREPNVPRNVEAGGLVLFKTPGGNLVAKLDDF
jgi:hypothetical protein